MPEHLRIRIDQALRSVPKQLRERLGLERIFDPFVPYRTQTVKAAELGAAALQLRRQDTADTGKHVILVDFKYDGGGLGKGGTVTLRVDDADVAQGRIERTYPFRVSLDETLDFGEDTGTPVSEDYMVPFRFSGVLNRVVIHLSDAKLTPEDEEQIRRARIAIDQWR